MEEGESKVVYESGDRVRSLRGVVSYEDGFVVVRRRDGIYRFARSVVRGITTATQANGEMNYERRFGERQTSIGNAERLIVVA
jgi:hypothetical protein